MTAVKDKITIVDARRNEHLKELFFEQNIKLVYKVAFNTLKNLPLDKEEKLSLGNFGLLKAFNTYDENCGYAFSTYATRCITNEILMEDRKSVNKHRKKALSLDGKSAKDKDGNEMLLIDTIATKEDEFNKDDYNLIGEVYEKFVEVYSNKEPKLITVFNMYVIENKTTIEIGKAVGHTQSHTSRLAAKAIKAIQEIAIEMEVIEGFNRYARYAKRSTKEKPKIRDSKLKQRTLYILLNYPELDIYDVNNIVNWNTVKIGMLKMSYKKGTFKLPPDDSIKHKVEEYIINKKLYA